VFAALTLCFGFALLTGTLGLSTAFGAFVAGMLVARARETHWVHQALEPLRVIFMALFFVSVGVILDLDFVYENWWKISLLVFAILMSNTLLNAVTFRVLGESWRDSLYGGALLSQIGEFSFVLAAAGYHAAIIDDRDHQFAVAIITLSLMVSPVWITAAKRLLLRRVEPCLLPPR
jgi:CPA2 family monovalent cation:H+ antiporter-2